MNKLISDFSMNLTCNKVTFPFQNMTSTESSTIITTPIDQINTEVSSTIQDSTITISQIVPSTNSITEKTPVETKTCSCSSTDSTGKILC